MKFIIKRITPPFLYDFGKNILSRKKNASEQDSAFYDKMFIEHHHWKKHYTSSEYYPLWTIIVDRILKSDSKSVLDIGCGAGQFARFLKDKGIRNYIGIDFSPERVKYAKNICPEFEFMLADVYKSDVFNIRQFDTIVCLEFLEHVNHDLELFEKIRTGINFFGTVPNFPFVAHVRYFENPEEVQSRYNKVIKNLSIDTHLKNEKGKKFYIMEGITA